MICIPVFNFCQLEDPAIFTISPRFPPSQSSLHLGGISEVISITVSTIQQVFVDYIARHDLDPAQALEVATKLEAIGITAVKDFVGYFSDHHEGPTVYKFWNSIAEWKTKGSILATLRDMLLTLQDNEAEGRQTDRQKDP